MLWHAEKSRSIFDYKKQTNVMWNIGKKHVKREGMYLVLDGKPRQKKNSKVLESIRQKEATTGFVLWKKVLLKISQ